MGPMNTMQGFQPTDQSNHTHSNYTNYHSAYNQLPVHELSDESRVHFQSVSNQVQVSVNPDDNKQEFKYISSCMYSQQTNSPTLPSTQSSPNSQYSVPVSECEQYNALRQCQQSPTGYNQQYYSCTFQDPNQGCNAKDLSTRGMNANAPVQTFHSQSYNDSACMNKFQTDPAPEYTDLNVLLGLPSITAFLGEDQDSNHDSSDASISSPVSHIGQEDGMSPCHQSGSSPRNLAELQPVFTQKNCTAPAGSLDSLPGQTLKSCALEGSGNSAVLASFTDNTITQQTVSIYDILSPASKNLTDMLDTFGNMGRSHSGNSFHSSSTGQMTS